MVCAGRLKNKGRRIGGAPPFVITQFAVVIISDGCESGRTEMIPVT